MGAASNRIKKSKHKSKVKQLIDMFYKQHFLYSLNEPIRQSPSQWFDKNLEPNVKVRVQSCWKLPKRNPDSNNFLKYYQQFISSNNSLQFKEFSDVEYLEQNFQVIKFKCLLNKKVTVFGEVWIVVNTGKIYKVALNEQYTGPSAFEIQWKIQSQKHNEWINDPKNRKYMLYNNKNQNKQDKNVDFDYQQRKKKELQHQMGMYYQQRKQGTFGGTYWH